MYVVVQIWCSCWCSGVYVSPRLMASCVCLSVCLTVYLSRRRSTVVGHVPCCAHVMLTAGECFFPQGCISLCLCLYLCLLDLTFISLSLCVSFVCSLKTLIFLWWACYTSLYCTPLYCSMRGHVRPVQMWRDTQPPWIFLETSRDVECLLCVHFSGVTWVITLKRCSETTTTTTIILPYLTLPYRIK